MLHKRCFLLMWQRLFGWPNVYTEALQPARGISSVLCILDIRPTLWRITVQTLNSGIVESMLTYFCFCGKTSLWGIHKTEQHSCTEGDGQMWPCRWKYPACILDTVLKRRLLKTRVDHNTAKDLSSHGNRTHMKRPIMSCNSPAKSCVQVQIPSAFSTSRLNPACAVCMWVCKHCGNPRPGTVWSGIWGGTTSLPQSFNYECRWGEPL